MAAEKTMEEVLINPNAPDDHFVSPSGSGVWCTVGTLKRLLAERELCREVLRTISQFKYQSPQNGSCPTAEARLADCVLAKLESK
jgi:hypothetical protein